MLEPLPRRFSLQEMMLAVVFACIVALVYRGSPAAAFLTIVGAGLGVTTSYIKEINFVLAIVLFAGFCLIGCLTLSPLLSLP